MGTKFLTGGSQDIITELWDLVVIFRNSGLPGTVKIKINDHFILSFLQNNKWVISFKNIYKKILLDLDKKQAV